MLETKMFEIRDRATFFVVYATRAKIPYNSTTPEQEAYLFQRDGFDLTASPLVLLSRCGWSCHYDPHAWASRTYTVAHQHITNKWDDLTSGDVIDVEYILGEAKEPKLSERITNKDLF